MKHIQTVCFQTVCLKRIIAHKKPMSTHFFKRNKKIAHRLLGVTIPSHSPTICLYYDESAQTPG